MRNIDLWPVAIAGVLIVHTIWGQHSASDPTTWHDVGMAVAWIFAVVVGVPVAAVVAFIVCAGIVMVAVQAWGRLA